MEHRLANDWKNRLAIECNRAIEGEENWSETAVRSVLKLLGWYGVPSDELPSKRDAVIDALPPPVLKGLRQTRDQLTGRLERTTEWRVDDSKFAGPPDMMGEVEDLLGYIEEAMRLELDRVLGEAYNGSFTTTVFGGAKWTVFTGTKKKRVFQTLWSVKYGNVIQSLCPLLSEGVNTEGKVILEGGNMECEPSFWMVVAVLECVANAVKGGAQIIPKNYERKIYAVVRPLEPHEECHRLRSTTSPIKFVLELGRDCRKVLPLHDCSNAQRTDGKPCEIRLNRTHIVHSRTVE